jgi:hypothetical protein
MKKKLFVLGIFLLSLSTNAQKGQAFPAVSGTLLNDKAMSLPLKNGKETIVAIAFHRGAEDELKKWLNPLYYTFMKKPDKKDNKFDMAEVYDVNFVFIPMISGFKKFAEDFKASTQKEFWPYILDTEKTDVKGMQKQLGLKDNKIPYFFTLDKNGKITSMQSGEYSEAKVDEMEEAVSGD